MVPNRLRTTTASASARSRRRAVTVLTAILSVAILFNANPAQAAVTKSLIVYQGDISYWKLVSGTVAVANTLAQADVLIISHAKYRRPGATSCGSYVCWPNNVNGATGDACNSENHRATWIEVLGAVDSMRSNLGKQPQIVFGYTSGAADATYEGSLSPQCGNNVNNFRAYLTPVPNSTLWYNCPGAGCSNFVSMVNDWLLPQGDTLNQQIDGIFIDYVNQTKMPNYTRDNLYSYIRNQYPTKRIAANSLIPGYACDPAVCGIQNNYEFPADSTLLRETFTGCTVRANCSDYILVEGYYAAGFSGNNGQATLLRPETAEIGGNIDGILATNSIRNIVDARPGRVRPLIASLVTEPSDAGFTTLSCGWSDFTTAKTIFNASAGDGDAIGYQFADLGLDLSNSPPTVSMTVCS